MEYDSHRNAALARRMLVPGNLFLFDMPIQRVDWAEPEIEVDEVVMAQVSHPGATLARLLPIVVMALDLFLILLLPNLRLLSLFLPRQLS